MKKQSLLLAAFAMLTSVSAFAQASATTTASASATVIRPITLTKVTDLNFGSVVPSAAAGTVTVVPAGTRSAGGGAGLAGSAGVTAASFTVGGEGAATYAITLPAAAVVITSGANNMNVTGFTSTPAATGTIGGAAGTAGTQTLNVGAVLNVGANQNPGTYTGTFSVTVAYN